MQGTLEAKSAPVVPLLTATAKGVLLALAAVCLFMGVLLALAVNASLQSGLPEPVPDTLALWGQLLPPAVAGGALTGAFAGRLEHRRLPKLLGLAAVAYVLGSVWVTLELLGGASAAGRVASVLLGVWASVAYGVFIVPLWAGGIVLLERWTRRRSAASTTG